MNRNLISFDQLVNLIPADFRQLSGKVFYSGRRAFSAESPLYVLGVNPGGDPEHHRSETVSASVEAVRNLYPENWSAYRDESWEGALPGKWGMQPRILHLFRVLKLDPGQIPCSNLVFVRSRREADLDRSLLETAERCWPFHARIITQLRPRTILCLGQTAGDFVRRKLGADSCVEQFTEQNRRKWVSRAFQNRDGLNVVVATHPSIADWTNPNSDPTRLVRLSNT